MTTVADSETNTSDTTDQVDSWLHKLQHALTGNSLSSVESLFEDNAYWRDLLGLGWSISTSKGATNIANTMLQLVSQDPITRITLDPRVAPVRQVTRAGRETIEAFFRFENTNGRGRGVVRLIDQTTLDSTAVKAWTVMTALDEIKGHEELIGKRRPKGDVFSRNIRGPNWADKRKAAIDYDNRDPDVLVVGGGQAGLSVAARLTVLGIDTLVIDKNPRIGDNWRNRYHALVLHNQVYANHMPYMPFPPNWPEYIAKDKLANWFESYADAMELNVWTSAELTSGEYDSDSQRWTATIRQADGRERSLRPKHIVMATSVSSIPKLPDIPTLAQFEKKVIHASEYQHGEDYQGCSALVIGVGTSAHDIAQDLAASGAAVTMIQRGPTMIVNVEPGAQLPYTLYHEGLALEECDLITIATPFPIVRQAHVGFTQTAREQDTQLLDKLQQRGMQLDFGEEGTGWQFKYLTRGGGYYFNVGASEMIADGRIGLIQYDTIKHFDASGIELQDTRRIDADLVVLATGYQGMNAVVEQMFGSDVNNRIGPVWGFDDEGFELSNMYNRTPQPGLWFIGGSFAQCRIYSKYLALQIKASEEGLLD